MGIMKNKASYVLHLKVIERNKEKEPNTWSLLLLAPTGSADSEYMYSASISCSSGDPFLSGPNSTDHLPTEEHSYHEFAASNNILFFQVLK